MKKLKKRDGVLEIDLEPREAVFLLSLADKIPAALETSGNRRLFPACAEDETVDREMRDWLHPELKAARLERVAAFRSEVQAAIRNKLQARLDHEAVARWVGLLNDLRLIFAGELNIDSDDWSSRLTAEQRDQPGVHIYLYLTGLQAALIEEGLGVDPAG